MAHDIPRLIAGCDRDLAFRLIQEISPENSESIDWTCSGRELGRRVAGALRDDTAAWPKLQNIESLARHGGIITIRSVLYQHRKLRDELDELCGTSETAAVWLALQGEELFQSALSALHVDRGLNKRSWKAFRVPLRKDVRISFDPDAQNAFERHVREAIRKCSSFDTPGKLVTHHLQRTLFPDHSHSRRLVDQVTVYAEARTVAEDAFDDKERLATQVRRKVENISVVLDRERRELDVVTLGGRTFIEDVAGAFCLSFTGDAPQLEPLVRRGINFQVFRERPPMPLDGQTRFRDAKVDEIRVRSPSGSLMTFDSKSLRDSGMDVYDCAAADFQERSPFRKGEWVVVSARIALFKTPTEPGKSPRVRTVELKPNGHTNLREQDDTDCFIADELLTRWGILEPSDENAG